MKQILLNILAVIAGALIGSVVNGGIIAISSFIIPPPTGADVTTLEGLKASMHLFTPINFLMPWLAHAIGTLAGAIIASLIAANNKIYIAIAVGILFLIGGIANVIMLPSPTWFTIVDLAGAYIPVAYLGAKLVLGKKSA